MKITRSATSRAKPISCVTTIIVMPSPASSRITSSTSLTSSGSSALVTSSKSITCGSIASARAIATRCCWPPDRRSGYSSTLADIPTRSSSARASGSTSEAGRSRTLIGPEGDVLERVHVREQVELLEDHADALADDIDVVLPLISWPSSRICPCSAGSSRLMQRSSVDLPEPDGPSTQTTWPRLIVRSMPCRTLRRAEALVDALETEHRLFTRSRHCMAPAPPVEGGVPPANAVMSGGSSLEPPPRCVFF